MELEVIGATSFVCSIILLIIIIGVIFTIEASRRFGGKK